jgi:hypothetical protein
MKLDGLVVAQQQTTTRNEVGEATKSLPINVAVDQGSTNDNNVYAVPVARIRNSMSPGDCYSLCKRRIIVGRKSKYLNQCDIIVEQSNFISRMHFSIELNETVKKFFIYCMSKNGIFVNNKYVQRGTPYILDEE